MNRKYVAWIVTTLVLAAAAAPSFGCAVCFGNSDSPMGPAVHLSILFMVAVTYFVIGSGLVAFLVLRSRARRRTAISPPIPPEGAAISPPIPPEGALISPG